MRNNNVVAIATITAAVLLVGGCSAENSVTSDPNNPKQVEVITWWTEGLEKAALYDLVTEFKSENPGIQFIDASVTGVGGAAARQAIDARLSSSNPPDTFQATAGVSLADYVAHGDLQDLTTFFSQNGLDDVYPSGLLETVSVDARPYAVPAGIHRVNVLWSNDDVLRSAGIDPAVAPATIDDWIANLGAIRSSGIEYPLALGDDLTQLELFETVLIANMGAQSYQTLWTSSQRWEGPGIAGAVEDFGRLLDFTDPSSSSNEWSQAVHSVIRGKAAYVIVADYALPTFRRAGFDSGDAYSAHPSPGSAGIFDFFADTFTLPVGAVHTDSAEAWLLSVSSLDGQRLLSLTNGSIPARTDTTPDGFSPYQQGMIADWQTNAVVPSMSHGVAASSSWGQSIAAALVQFRNGRAAEALVNDLIDAANARLD